MHKSILTIAIAALALGTLFACDRMPNSPSGSGAAISVFTDPAAADPVAGKRVIDFEDQPVDGSSTCTSPGPLCTLLSNPLTLDGVVFTDPASLMTGFCSSPSCVPDPHDASGGNLVLMLNPGGTIDFPGRMLVVSLTIQGIGDNPFRVKVTDGSGDTRTVDGAGVSYAATTLGFRSPRGIARVEILSVGGTGGPLVLSEIGFVRGPML